MIVVPLLLMPAMMFLIGGLMASSMKGLEEQNYTVALVNEDAAPDVVDSLQQVATIEYLNAGTADQARQLVLDGIVQAAVILPEGGLGKQMTPAPKVEIMYQESREKSTIAFKRIRSQLQSMKSSMTHAWLNELGIDETILEPIEIESNNLSSDSEMATAGIASFLPYILILMSITGAIYPAIDMTAGEKERSTLETLLASPAGRLDIVLGKLLTVMTTSFVSTVLSLTSFSSSYPSGSTCWVLRLARSWTSTSS